MAAATLTDGKHGSAAPALLRPASGAGVPNTKLIVIPSASEESLWSDHTSAARTNS